jgi:transcriptional regulator with XRE-family HTH domain
MSFGERLRAERERQGLTRNALSKLSGVPRSVIIRVEEDPDASLTVVSAAKLARVLRVSLDYLTGIWEPDVAATLA